MSEYTTTATCKKCGIEYPLTDEFFPPRKNSKTGFRSHCRECERNRGKVYRAANAEQRREHSKRYRAANADKVRESKKRYYAENADMFRVYYAENREKVRESQKRWRQNNPEKKKARDHRRSARQRDLLATFTATEWQKALEYFDHRCAVCGRPAGLWHTLAADHWIPISSMNCPGTVAGNIVPLCHGDGGCNNSKRARDAEEWLVDRFGKRRAKAILQRIETYFQWVRERGK